MADDKPRYHRLLTLDERADGRRADAYLAARFSLWSRSTIARYMAAGLIERGGRRLKPSSILRGTDRLEIYAPGIAPDGPPPPLPPILYEDEALLVLDKPSGLLPHPAGQSFVYSVINLARTARPDHRVDLVHRLDRDTSGILVLTKNTEANAILKDRLKHRRGFHKEYLAIVRGNPDWEQIEIEAPIGTALDSTVRLRKGTRPDGLTAHTSVRIRTRLTDHALVQCVLHTGRNHQIRVHLEHIGHPILGDRLYGQPDEIFLHCLEKGINARIRGIVSFPRQALHAWRLTLPHPDGRSVQIEAPLPADMQAIVDGAPVRWPDPED